MIGFRTIRPYAMNAMTFFVDGPVTYSQPFMTRLVKFIGVTWIPSGDKKARSVERPSGLIKSP
jgi:hypothetical protein